MAEAYRPPVDLTALSGTSGGAGAVFPTKDADPHYEELAKYWSRVADALIPLTGMEVYKDGAALDIGVRAGTFFVGATAVDYAGATAQTLANNDTTYIYLDPDGTLQTSLTGFPDVPHIPLATVATGSESGAGVSGAFDVTDIVDYRGRVIFSVPAWLDISAGAEAADVRAITISGGSWRSRVRVWIAASDFGAPSATGNTVALTTGTQLRALTANADYEFISDGSGQVVFDLTITGAATRYILAEVDGRIISSGQLDWAA